MEQQKQILGEAKAEADRTADKADEIYTTTVEKAKQFEQEVKADADAYDKQIRQKAQEDSNAIVRTRTPAPTDHLQRPAAIPKAGG
ncbi:MAG: hypothetical protein ACLUI3_16575 [Christensenellales bacterium]